jgi:hypothetical protein
MPCTVILSISFSGDRLIKRAHKQADINEMLFVNLCLTLNHGELKLIKRLIILILPGEVCAFKQFVPTGSLPI